MSKKTLFLDRDGVINRQIVGGYVTQLEAFEFLPGVLDAMAVLAQQFDYIFVVTNQQGIGKGEFSVDDLKQIHTFMLEKINQAGGRIDKIYFCPELESADSINRKPNPGMGLKALQEFPAIDLNATIMVGDSLLDMQFGKNLGVTTVFLTNGKKLLPEIDTISNQTFTDLLDFSKHYSFI